LEIFPNPAKIASQVLMKTHFCAQIAGGKTPTRR